MAGVSGAIPRQVARCQAGVPFLSSPLRVDFLLPAASLPVPPCSHVLRRDGYLAFLVLLVGGLPAPNVTLVTDLRLGGFLLCHDVHAGDDLIPAGQIHLGVVLLVISLGHGPFLGLILAL